ncbi:MAG: recombination regulator RecX [Carnobacterium sp.]|uniref:Regulatory protein RecX n=1 Tax=Carnobacterium antarcticum TaxID=2126436 RepID=A0ABW4NQZ4_9LACT|nr:MULTISPECIES: recombination regulator RecX [unclassified Carnobacterium]ALV21376.1 regulatory protein RecX [Carnobacterium sp. CP1]QQP69389.1 recombination regulator RecX [Carnobacterium sp. CS13]
MKDDLLKEILSSNKSEAGSSVPKITKIGTQKRKGRYNIYLDEEYAFPVDEAILIKFSLHKGMEVSEAFREELESEDGTRKAYVRSLNYLNYGLRSEKEVRDDLAKHDFSDAADEVVEQLKEQGYLDDLMYAESYTRTGANVGGKGPRVIKQELKKRGISEEYIEKAAEQYPFDQMVENGVQLAEKVIRRSGQYSSRETNNKLRQNLMQKGFDADIITQVLEEVTVEKEEDEEYAAIKRQGDKIWRKQAKLKGYKKAQKVKSSLFQKGFAGDLINQFIEEKEMEDQAE